MTVSSMSGCKVNHLVETNMARGMLNYKTKDHDGVTQTWDVMQENVSHLYTTNIFSHHVHPHL